MSGQVNHTVCFAASLVNTGANNHDIVDDSETAFAANPFASFAHDIAVSQHGGFVHDNAATMELLGIWEFIFGEELPC